MLIPYSAKALFKDPLAKFDNNKFVKLVASFFAALATTFSTALAPTVAPPANLIPRLVIPLANACNPVSNAPLINPIIYDCSKV